MVSNVYKIILKDGLLILYSAFLHIAVTKEHIKNKPILTIKDFMDCLS